MSALPDPQLPEIVSLSQLNPTDLDPLLQEETVVWHHRFAWDFRPAADVLRRFIRIRSLLGYALRIGRDVVGYAYYVCEGKKGIIGDFYFRDGHSHTENEQALLHAVVNGLIHTAGIRRIESQLMLLRDKTAQPPYSAMLSRHERFFMETPAALLRLLKPLPLAVQVRFVPWAERYHDEIAHLVASSYKGHVDSEINDQYRTVAGARHFLMNIIKYPGCGNFSPACSILAIDGRTGRVCGACLTSLVSINTGHITQLCVLPGLRGSGLGYELLRGSMIRLTEAGCNSIGLTVTASNQKAIRLYESVGYRSISTFPALVWEGF